MTSPLHGEDPGFKSLWTHILQSPEPREKPLKFNQNLCLRKAMQPTKNLLKDLDVKRWHDNLARGSKLTASVRLRRLNLFCQRTGKTPTDLVSVGSADIVKLENILLDHVSWLESQNYAPGYIDGILKAIRSWLAFNYVELKRRIKIKNADIPVTIQDERFQQKKSLHQYLMCQGHVEEQASA